MLLGNHGRKRNIAGLKLKLIMRRIMSFKCHFDSLVHHRRFHWLSCCLCMDSTLGYWKLVCYLHCYSGYSMLDFGFLWHRVFAVVGHAGL